jgi:hypothetical protein
MCTQSRQRHLAVLGFFAMLFAVVFLASCSLDSEQKGTTVLTGPSADFGRYWETSKNGRFDEVNTFLADSPERFMLCKMISREECDVKLSKDKGKTNDPADPNIVRKEITLPKENQLISTNIPYGIASGKWESYVFKNEAIVGDEARIRIVVSGPGFSLDRDVLMMRIGNTWKIFAVVDPGDFEHWAG